MKDNRSLTPLGTKDLLMEDSLFHREIESKLSALFMRRGFSEVMTPGMEFLDVFMGERPLIPPEMMYKMTDTKGRLMVMRPDSTLPIARLAATRLQNAPLPLRLYYAQDVYQMNHGLTGHADQEFQAGVELIGAAGKRADLEVITLAAGALREIVGDAFRIEIGHVGFFESLIEELNADRQIEEEIRDLIEGKNYAALTELLDTLPACAAVSALKRLPHLFGGRQVLSEAMSLCHTQRGCEALEYMADLYQSLCDMGLEKHVIFDFGMLHSNEYYTGIIFRGYVEGSGEIALSGGRYDALLAQFGTPRAAVGFAIKMDELMRVLKANGHAPCKTPCAILVHALDGFEAKALGVLAEYAEKDVVCEFSVRETVEESTNYAKAKHIPQIIVVGEQITAVEV